MNSVKLCSENYTAGRWTNVDNSQSVLAKQLGPPVPSHPYYNNVMYTLLYTYCIRAITANDNDDANDADGHLENGRDQ